MWIRKVLHWKAQKDKIRRNVAGRLGRRLSILNLTFKGDNEVDVERFGKTRYRTVAEEDGWSTMFLYNGNFCQR